MAELVFRRIPKALEDNPYVRKLAIDCQESMRTTYAHVHEPLPKAVSIPPDGRIGPTISTVMLRATHFRVRDAKTNSLTHGVLIEPATSTDADLLRRWYPEEKA